MGSPPKEREPFFPAVEWIKEAARRGMQRLPCGHMVEAGHALVYAGEYATCSDECAEIIRQEGAA